MAERAAKRLKRITIQDVARAAEVSPTTVSLVLQDKGDISPETRKRVLGASRTLGYRYANGSAPLRKASGFVGILIDSMENPYFTEMVEPLENSLTKAGYASLILTTYSDKKRQDHLLDSLPRLRLSGLALVPAAGTDKASLKKIEALGIPFAMGIRHLGFGEFDYVGPNYFNGMQQAAQHLTGLGHEAIAFVGGEENNTAYTERLSSFTSFMQKNSLSVATSWMVPGPPNFQTGRSSLKTLLLKNPNPTAIIAYNDLVAFGIMRGLQDLGLQAGRDLAVLGFDGIRDAERQTVPLTTVSTPPERIGRELAQLILNRIKKPHALPINIMPPPKLIVRQSCGG